MGCYQAGRQCYQQARRRPTAARAKTPQMQAKAPLRATRASLADARICRESARAGHSHARISQAAAPEQRGPEAAHRNSFRRWRERALLLPEARAVRKAAHRVCGTKRVGPFYITHRALECSLSEPTPCNPFFLPQRAQHMMNLHLLVPGPARVRRGAVRRRPFGRAGKVQRMHTGAKNSHRSWHLLVELPPSTSACTACATPCSACRRTTIPLRIARSVRAAIP